MSVALIIYYSDNSSSEYRLFILMIALKRTFDLRYILYTLNTKKYSDYMCSEYKYILQFALNRSLLL